ncbi:hypothetical protein ACQEVZ_47800 [Dactylosporangium sp. CA-152071]
MRDARQRNDRVRCTSADAEIFGFLADYSREAVIPGLFPGPED